MKAEKRRRGRAIRKAARLRRENPAAADALGDLREAFELVLPAIREAWAQITRAVRETLRFATALSYRARPLIHNGRKYQR